MVIGAVLVPGAKAPTLVSNDLVKRMKSGSVLVDIAIDQGGCFDLGWRDALRQDAALASGLNIHDGRLTNASVGTALHLPSVEVASVLA